jgi:hypothetical protein
MNELTLKDAIKELEELSTGDWVPYEYSPEEAKLILNHINNLQSKINKINQYLEEYFIFDDKNGEYYQIHTFDKDNAKELHDILKEDK